MRLSSGRGGETGGNWIILVALVAAFAAIVAAIFELKNDGAKYAKAFVREDALRILIVPELSDPIDGLLHAFALEEDLNVERLYRAPAQVQAWLDGQADAMDLPPIDAVLHRGADQPVLVRLKASGRSLALDRLEAWFQSPAVAEQLQAAGVPDGFKVVAQ